MWTAKIISKGLVDASGNIEVVYQILVDGEIMYDNLRASSAPDMTVTNIKAAMATLKEKVEASETISEGQIIEL